MKIENFNNKGFSLVEVLVYTVVLVFVIQVLFSLITNTMGEAQYYILKEKVNQNARLIITRINQEIKTSKSIDSLSSDKLTLTRFDGSSMDIYWLNSDKMVYLDTGSGGELLSSDDVLVDSFQFASSGDGVEFEFEISASEKNYWLDLDYEFATGAFVVPRTEFY
ncbi:hypothetical protein C0583_06980 [Candidatus Parcubacteria bacterium]|nr:MAG: hypothetical protein C0583_06980 [Candidatus Parcubacteria bacterium]